MHRTHPTVQERLPATIVLSFLLNISTGFAPKPWFLMRTE